MSKILIVEDEVGNRRFGKGLSGIYWIFRWISEIPVMRA